MAKKMRPFVAFTHGPFAVATLSAPLNSIHLFSDYIQGRTRDNRRKSLKSIEKVCERERMGGGG